jgi:16S rRNA (cytosine1407-C5)-methyltransferase
MKKLQKEIILSSLQLLKPGGFLIYSTCTFSIEENEKNVDEILKENSNVELIDINENRFTKGIFGNISIDDKVIRVLPHKSEYDGFFIAALKKKGELIIDDKHEKNIEETKINQFFPGHKFEGAFKSADGLVFFQKENRLIEKIKFNKTGIKAGKIVKNELELSSQFLWEFGKFFNENKKIYIKREVVIGVINFLLVTSMLLSQQGKETKSSTKIFEDNFTKISSWEIYKADGAEIKVSSSKNGEVPTLKIELVR